MPGQELSMEKLTKGNNSKIMKCRVTVLVHCTQPQWDLSVNEISNS